LPWYATPYKKVTDYVPVSTIALDPSLDCMYCATRQKPMATRHKPGPFVHAGLPYHCPGKFSPARQTQRPPASEEAANSSLGFPQSSIKTSSFSTNRRTTSLFSINAATSIGVGIHLPKEEPTRSICQKSPVIWPISILTSSTETRRHGPADANPSAQQGIHGCGSAHNY
jgi:hypothetical protein